jgi:hypothetical protein
MTVELIIVAACTVGLLVTLTLALCKAAAGGDVRVEREYDCSRREPAPSVYARRRAGEVIDADIRRERRSHLTSTRRGER